MLGARTFTGNPYDGHILSASLEQATNLTQDLQVEIKEVVVDLGYRGVDEDNPGKLIIHRGKFKSLCPQQKAWLRRRQAIEPAIGHLKSDHRLDRCWLKGEIGDALHAISCAAGYNLRWLLRAVARLGIGPIFLRLLQALLHLTKALRRFVWNPTITIAGRSRARWACGQAALGPVHMSTGQLLNCGSLL